MRFVGAAVLGFALMVGSADAHHCETKCTPVRTVVAGVVSAQPVRFAIRHCSNCSYSFLVQAIALDLQ